MLKVMQMHRDAVEAIDESGPRELKASARRLWDEVLSHGRQHGFRNAQATVLAPTGTISFMMDCDTTGIEPDIALVKYKQLAGGGMLKIVNRTVPLGLRKLGYDSHQIESISKYVDEHDTIEGAPDLKMEHLSVFDCAFKPAQGTRSIPWKAHVTMMAAAQPFLSGAISKTVNMPHESTPKDIADAYFWGWELGLKAIAIYRDGSKQSQPLSTKSEGDKQKQKEAAASTETKQVERIVYKPRRERLPDTRQSVTHKFNIAGHEGYLNVGLYPDGRPGELFITMAKEGSTIGGLMDAFGTAISLSLQYGVPLEVLVNKFSHTRFEPMGHTSHPDIRIAKSVVDYIFRWMGLTFLAGYREAATGQLPGGDKPTEKPAKPEKPAASAEAPRAAAKATNGHAEKSAATHELNPSVGKVGGNGSTEAVETNARFQLGELPAIDLAALERAGVALRIGGHEAPLSGRSDQFARFQSDAPSCDNCGSITVRNGNCYLCHNCGNSMGCS
jgi:ribonucleoside-diphosphate reductase alpha chain